jgi:hypothetical protein
MQPWRTWPRSRRSANLREISVVLLGSYDPEQGAEYPVYIVGIDADGNLVGLKSAVIWT